jgi:hypothetical protein
MTAYRAADLCLIPICSSTLSPFYYGYGNGYTLFAVISLDSPVFILPLLTFEKVMSAVGSSKRYDGN